MIAGCPSGGQQLVAAGDDRVDQQRDPAPRAYLVPLDLVAEASDGAEAVTGAATRPLGDAWAWAKKDRRPTSRRWLQCRWPAGATPPGPTSTTANRAATRERATTPGQGSPRVVARTRPLGPTRSRGRWSHRGCAGGRTRPPTTKEHQRRCRRYGRPHAPDREPGASDWWLRSGPTAKAQPEKAGL
jgi:hypothetical protein